MVNDTSNPYLPLHYLPIHSYLCYYLGLVFCSVFVGEKGIKFDEQDRPTSAFFGSGSRPSTAILKSEFNKQNKDGKENENENDPLKPPKTPYHFKGSEAPATDTKLEDVVDELPDHVISRSGTPNQWAFD